MITTFNLTTAKRLVNDESQPYLSAFENLLALIVNVTDSDVVFVLYESGQGSMLSFAFAPSVNESEAVRLICEVATDDVRKCLQACSQLQQQDQQASVINHQFADTETAVEHENCSLHVISLAAEASPVVKQTISAFQQQLCALLKQANEAQQARRILSLLNVLQETVINTETAVNDTVYWSQLMTTLQLHTHVSAAMIARYDVAHKAITILGSSNGEQSSPDTDEIPVRFALTESVNSQLTANKTPIFIEGSAVAEIFIDEQPAELISTTQNVLLTPLLLHDVVIAVLVLSNVSSQLRANNAELSTTIAERCISWLLTRDLLNSKKQAGLDVQAMVDASVEQNARKSEFLASMSHELRSPLNSIIGFAEILTMSPDEPLTEKQADYVDVIQNCGKHLLQLINQILDISKIDAGAIELKREVFNLRDIIDATLEEVTAMAAKNIIRIRNSVTTDVFVFADSVRSKQILINLLSNAIKYNREGGSVHIFCDIGTENAKVSVVDTGVGISEKNLTEVFKPFKRVDTQRHRQEGTGLGLAICRQLAERMQGEIGLTSEYGAGSEFWFTLPIAHSSIVETEDEIELMSDTQVISPVEQKWVIYVEDNPANVLLMQEYFDIFDNLTLVCVSNANQAISKAKEIHPALILKDLNLPGISGSQATEIIRKTPDLQDIPIVAVSALAMTEDMDRAIAAGMNEFVAKPVKFANIKHIVHKYLIES